MSCKMSCPLKCHRPSSKYFLIQHRFALSIFCSISKHSVRHSTLHFSGLNRCIIWVHEVHAFLLEFSLYVLQNSIALCISMRLWIQSINNTLIAEFVRVLLIDSIKCMKNITIGHSIPKMHFVSVADKVLRTR